MTIQQSIVKQEYLEELGPDQEIIKEVLDWFRLFACVPHGTWNEKELSDLLAQKSVELGWVVEQDQWGNLRIDIPGASDFESSAPIIIQGHIDMVCAVTEGSGYVPERDPITLVVKDGILRSDGRSSLGADCGLGLSIAFVVAGKKLRRPPIRMILTVAEETGLHGARLVDPCWLEGCNWLINVDGGSSDVIIISCAGGRQEKCTKALHNKPLPHNAVHAYELRLSGFKGGHSGAMIHLGRGNAIKLLGHFLGVLSEKADYDLADFRGGHASNAIPLEARAVLTVSDETALMTEVDRLRDNLASYYKNIDPDIKVDLKEVPLPEKVWGRDTRDDIINWICLLHDGVYAKHDTMPGQVLASSNIGLCRPTDQDEWEATVYTRCHHSFSEEIMGSRNDILARISGFTMAVDSYSGYAGNTDDPLVQIIDRVHQRQTGKRMRVESVHAGLELGVLGGKNTQLAVATIGPDYQNGHATTECAPIAGFPIFARLLAGILEELPLQES